MSEVPVDLGAMHQEWSAGQMRFADWGQCGLKPHQAVTGSFGCGEHAIGAVGSDS